MLAELHSAAGSVASVGVLSPVMKTKRLPKRFSLLDLALLGIATHKFSRTVAKDRITGVLFARLL